MELQMSTLTTYLPEITSETTGWVNRKPASATERAYQALREAARTEAARLIKDGARKYMRCPFYLNAIEAELTRRTPRIMIIRLHTLWNERRVQPMNYRSATLYARLMRARDRHYLEIGRAI